MFMKAEAVKWIHGFRRIVTDSVIFIVGLFVGLNFNYASFSPMIGGTVLGSLLTFLKEIIMKKLSEINEIIEKWREILPKEIELAEYTGNNNKFWELDTTFVNKVEQLSLFKKWSILNLVYRLSELKDKWEDFKGIKKYSSEKKKLFEMLKGTIILELYRHHFEVKRDILEGFYIFIYKEAILGFKGELSGYSYYQPMRGGIEKWQLRDCRRADGGGFFDYDYHELAEVSDLDLWNKLEYMHQKLIERCKKDHAFEILNVINLETKTKESKRNLDEVLENSILASLGKWSYAAY